MQPAKALLAALLLFGAVWEAARASDNSDNSRNLTIVSWGGAYEAAQRRALFTPFAQASGIRPEIVAYGGGLQALSQHAASEGWDVLDMIESDAIKACKAGLIGSLDHDALLASTANSSGEDNFRDDFIDGAFRPCSIAHSLFATVLAYNSEAFPGVKPARIEDFFDIERFPGKRAAEKSPDVILEWALIAEGVPVSQVYDLLSTERGFRLAFRKLDDIRDHLLWWTDADAPATLVTSGQAVMASGYNGRFFAAINARKAPLVIVWDGQIIGLSVWAIAAGADAPALARDFLRFALAPGQLARLAETIPYAPARASALAQVGRHWKSRILMRDHLPGAPHRKERLLMRDSAWYARTADLRRKRFEAWLAQGGP